jgi:hypothetical protein
MVETLLHPDDDRLKTYWILFGVLTLLVLLPVWSVEYVPLVDYSNHLARTFILYHFNDVGLFRYRYDLVLEPIPNLAIDLIVPLLLNVVGVKVAGKIFLTLTLILFNFGCHLLGKSIHGRPTWFALTGTLFSYNSMFLYGFVNYIFGLGAFLITLALWLKYRKKWSAMSFLVVCTLVFASYLAHLSAYVFLGVTLVTVTLFDYRSAKAITGSMLIGLLPLLPPLVTFVAFMKGSGNTGEIEWNSVLGKIVNAFSLILSYNYFVDAALVLTIAVTALVLALNAKNVEIKRSIFIAGCIFVLLFIVCPRVLFTSGAADARFVPPAAVLLLMALRFEVKKRIGQGALIIFLFVALIHIGSIWHVWRVIDRTFSAQVAMFSYLEDGARVYPISYPTITDNKMDRPLKHAIQYSTIDRHTFLPTLFALRGQQPLRFKHDPSPLKIDLRIPPDQVNWIPIFDNYDYIWCYKIDNSYIQYLRNRCQFVAAASGVVIFRVTRSGEEQAAAH